MKIREMLLIAGGEPLAEYRWGDDVVGLIHIETGLEDITVQQSGNYITGRLEHSGNTEVLDAELELEVVTDKNFIDPDEGKIQIVYKGKKFVVTAGLIGTITAALAIADIVRFKEVPTGKTLMDILEAIGTFL